MNIHYVAAYMAEFPSDKANSIHVMRMCEAFSSLGHEVTLYVRHKDISPEAIFDFYGMAATFDIVQIKSGLPKLNRIEHCVKAVRMARREGCDLLISRTAIAAYLGVKSSLRVVFDAHGPIWERNFVEALSFKALCLNPYLHKMTVNSSALKELYVKRGLYPRAGITVANNGASLAAISNSADVHLRGRPGALQVGYTGHLYPGRGIDVICECAKLMPECEFHIVGGSAPDVERWISETDVDNVHYYGFIKPSLVSSYLARFDVLLAPYQAVGVEASGGRRDQSKYMNPIKVMEYIASGRAIVASDLPAIREVLPRDAALFAAPGDAASWASCVERLKDARLRDELSFACRCLAKSVTWEARARKIIE